jgi:hypothetical protein
LADAPLALQDTASNDADQEPPPKEPIQQAVRFAYPLPLSPEQITFDPAFPAIYVGLSRRFDATRVIPSEPT